MNTSFAIRIACAVVNLGCFMVLVGPIRIAALILGGICLGMAAYSLKK